MQVRSKITSRLMLSVMFFIISQPLLAQPAIYQAGEYTVTLDQDPDLGRIYYGCDPKQRCIYLTQGTTWRDQKRRGISWENQGYTYSISWQEDANSPLELKVFNPQGRMILHRLMIPKR